LLNLKLKHKKFVTVYKFQDLKIILRNQFEKGIFINNDKLNRYNGLFLIIFSPQI